MEKKNDSLMKVLILSTYATTGGAAIAAGRLMRALEKNGAEVSMLSRKDISWWPSCLKPQSWSSLWERLTVFLTNGFNYKTLWAVDYANSGQDIIHTREYREADVIHLHWINQGFISLRTIEEIVKSGKRVIWTMHDEWPLEAVEHYTAEQSENDDRHYSAMSRRIMQRKADAYGKGCITFVACSQWLANIARRKPLALGQEVISIPNPIDSTLFHPASDKVALRTALHISSEERIVLFCCQNVSDTRKGFDYLIEACKHLQNVSIVIVGNNTDAAAALLPTHIKTYSLGTVRDPSRMAQLYALSDCFVTPSLHDNLPNTIMEAMSCGTPCVGFNVGGIPEMIDHETNGYVADYRNAQSLAEGITYVLDNHHDLSLAARQKVEQEYSEEAVAQRYIDIYRR